MKPPLTHPLGDPVVALAWSPDAKHLAVAGISGPCSILDAVSFRVVHPLAGHEGGTFALDWSPHGDCLATSGQAGRLRLWATGTGAQLGQMPCGADWVEQAEFSPNGEWVAARAGKHLQVWRTGGELVLAFDQHESTVAALAWRADSNAIATACYGHIRAWRLLDAKIYEDITWKGSFLSLAWSPTARFLCGGTQEGTIQFFRLPARQNDPLQMSGYPSKIRNLAWDREGRWLASDGGPVVIVWDVSGKGPANTKPQQLEGHPGRVSALDYQAAGPLLASGCDQGTVFIWLPGRTETHRHAARLSSGVTALRWSPAGDRLAVGLQDGTVAVWSDLGSLET